MTRSATNNGDMAYFGAPETRTVTTNTLARGVVSFSRLCAPQPLGYIAAPVREEAIMLGFQHRELQADVFLDDRKVEVRGDNVGTFTFYDYRREWACSINTAFEATNLYLPRAALDAMLDGERSGDLIVQPGLCTADPVISGLVMALCPVFEGEARPTTLFLDHLGWALAAHCAANYLEPRRQAASGKGGLASWQLRLAQDIMETSLNGEVRLADLAEACGLSVKHFARAFRVSCSVPPHRWLMQRRIERSQTMLLTTGRSLAEIAVACGFADQSHFTTTFRRHLGAAPGTWRRARRN